MIVLTEEKSNYSPDDQRWNKIPALRDGLQSWGKNFDYIVFIDADLLIMDDRFDVNLIITENPDSHIIMAKDGLDFANSGFLIVKNSEWSRIFLQRWWSMKGHINSFCDQHVLNHLSLSLERENSLYPNIHLVDQKRINSIWPAIETYQTADPILHMLGEYATTREAIGREAVKDRCSILADQSKVGLHFPKERVENLKATSMKIKYYEQLYKANETESLDDVEELSGIVHHICDSSTRTNNNHKLCNSIIVKTANFIERLIKLQERKQNWQGVVALMDIKYSHAYYNMTLTKDISTVIAMSKSLLSNINDMVAFINSDVPENSIHIHHFRAKVVIHVAKLLMELKRWKHAIQYLMVGVSEMSSALELCKGSENQSSAVFQGLVMMYIKASVAFSNCYWMVGDGDAAIEWRDIAIANVNQLRFEYHGEDRLLVELMLEINKLHKVINKSDNSGVFTPLELKYFALRN